MPAEAPALDDTLAAHLKGLGGRIRAQRERQKVSATAAAEAAGMSRVTLHRIERGEPSVTMGAYLGALSALGLGLELTDPLHLAAAAAAAGPVGKPLAGAAPVAVRLDAYPQLRRLAWQRPGVAELTPAEALSLYERNWRHLDPASFSPEERALVQALVAQWGGGRLLV